MCPRTLSNSVSAASKRLSVRAPIRSARRRTCAADSSPVIYSTDLFDQVEATFPATSNKRVDLPTPGSPANKTTDPATRPPPRTRSSSPIPVGMNLASAISTSLMGRALFRGVLPAILLREGADSSAGTLSSSVPQALQLRHCPSHLLDCQPHSEH